jgi:hypothetical protein
MMSLYVEFSGQKTQRIYYFCGVFVVVLAAVFVAVFGVLLLAVLLLTPVLFFDLVAAEALAFAVGFAAVFAEAVADFPGRAFVFGFVASALLSVSFARPSPSIAWLTACLN